MSEAETTTEQLARDLSAALKQTQAEGAQVSYDTGKPRGRKPGAGKASGPAPQESQSPEIQSPTVRGSDVATILAALGNLMFKRLDLPDITVQEQAALGNSIDMVLVKYNATISKYAPEFMLIGSIAAITVPRVIEYRVRQAQDITPLVGIPAQQPIEFARKGEHSGT